MGEYGNGNENEFKYKPILYPNLMKRAEQWKDAASEILGETSPPSSSDEQKSLQSLHSSLSPEGQPPIQDKRHNINQPPVPECIPLNEIPRAGVLSEWLRK